MMAVAARTNFQTSRRGWRPRRTSDARLATDIAASIRVHAEAGVIRTAWDYTSRLDIIGRVEALLGR